MSRTDRRSRPSGGTHGVDESVPVAWSYADADEFRLRMSLRATPAERLRDLEAMIDFNATVEARNPRVRRVVERLSEEEGGVGLERGRAALDEPASRGE